MHTGILHLEIDSGVWQSAAACTHWAAYAHRALLARENVGVEKHCIILPACRDAPSGESVEIVGCCCQHTQDYPIRRKCRVSRVMNTHSGQPYSDPTQAKTIKATGCTTQTHLIAPPRSERKESAHTSGFAHPDSFLAMNSQKNKELPHTRVHQTAPPKTYSSGQVKQQAPCTPTPTTIDQPKPSSTQSTEKPLFQDWERSLFHLTHRIKHRKLNKINR